ncbi:MAG: ribosomal protein [Gammaproteobacteria bacterium]|nr:ribosomal protein [Gammaproteobacteria bacterium]
MALTRQDKEKIVAEMVAVASQSLSAVVALNHGMTAGETTELRAKARQMNVYLRVVPNTLLIRAVAGTEFECLAEQLTGPTVIAFSKEEPGSAGRLIRDFAKTHEKLGIKAFAVGGMAYDAKQIDMLASLPTREEALATLMSVMQAPVTKLARTTSETYAKLVRAVAAVRDQKQAA